MRLEILIRRAQKGNKEAFGELYREFYEKIYRYCKFNSRSQEAAQDFCQETFLRAWKSLPSFSLKKGGTFQAFLFKIARNLVIDASRKKQTVKLELFEQLETGENIEEEFDKQESAKRLKKALLNLDYIERQILILRYFEEMALSEVAKIIGIRDGALRVRIHRVLKKLKEILGRMK